MNITPANLTKRLWFVASSMKTGLALLVLIVFIAFIGTIITPGVSYPEEKPFQHLLFNTIGLKDVYHSSWFQVLLGLLAMNLLFCSIKRLPSILRLTFGKNSDEFEIPSTHRGQSYEITSSLTLNQLLACLEKKLGNTKKAFKKSEDAGRIVFFYESGKYARMGSLAVHLSIIVILLGALYGSWYGFSEELRIAVGQVKQIDSSFNPRITTPFQIRLDSFDVELYSDKSVSDWISRVTVLENDQPVRQTEIKVNHPLNQHGIYLYQMTHGTAISTEVWEQGNVVRRDTVAEESAIILTGATELLIRPIRFIPDYEPRNSMAARSSEPAKPYVFFAAYQDQQLIEHGYVQLGDRVQIDSQKSFVFTHAVAYSGLQVKHDPGIPIVWCGFIMMLMGFFISLYSKPARIWIEMLPHGDDTQIILSWKGKSANQIKESMIEIINDLTPNLKEE